jgi:hypothetical protein
MLSSHGHFTQRRPPRAYQELIPTDAAGFHASVPLPPPPSALRHLPSPCSHPTPPVALRPASSVDAWAIHELYPTPMEFVGHSLPPHPRPHSPHHPARAASACVLKKKICLKKGRVTHHRFPPTHRDKVARPCLPAPSTNSTGVATSSWARHARTATQPVEWPPYAIP